MYNIEFDTHEIVVTELCPKELVILASYLADEITDNNLEGNLAELVKNFEQRLDQEKLEIQNYYTLDLARQVKNEIEECNGYIEKRYS